MLFLFMSFHICKKIGGCISGLYACVSFLEASSLCPFIQKRAVQTRNRFGHVQPGGENFNVISRAYVVKCVVLSNFRAGCC